MTHVMLRSFCALNCYDRYACAVGQWVSGSNGSFFRWVTWVTVHSFALSFIGCFSKLFVLYHFSILFYFFLSGLLSAQIFGLIM